MFEMNVLSIVLSVCIVVVALIFMITDITQNTKKETIIEKKTQKNFDIDKDGGHPFEQPKVIEVTPKDPAKPVVMTQQNIEPSNSVIAADIRSSYMLGVDPSDFFVFKQDNNGVIKAELSKL